MVRIEFYEKELYNKDWKNGLLSCVDAFTATLEKMKSDPEYSENGDLREVLKTLREKEKHYDCKSSGSEFFITIT